MNNNDIMFITFKLKTLEELLKKIIIKVDTIEENFKILKVILIVLILIISQKKYKMNWI
jgi:hypothetical protein